MTTPENPVSGSAPKSRAHMSPDDLQLASDAALVVAISRYQQEALAETYRRHGGAVFALARRLLVDRSLAEEIVQEVFLRLWNQPERFDPERGSLRSYLLAQCHGRSVDSLRSETARRNREDREVRRAAEAGYDLELEVVDMVVADNVRDALASTSEGEREAITLAYFGGHTYREVADDAVRAGGNGEEPHPLRSQAPARGAGGRRLRGRVVSVLSHDEISRLLGAYALDAVEPDERAIVEQHVAGCPQCRAEVAEHLEVAGLLGNEGGVAPEGLWDRIAGALEETPPPLRLAPVPLPARRGPSTRIVALAAAAALVVIAALGFQVFRQADRIDRLEASQAEDALTQAASLALADSESRSTSLASADQTQEITAVLTPDGSGYLFTGDLAALPEDETYQLWGIDGENIVSLGVLGSDPGDVVAFRAAPGVPVLAVTEEVADGVPQPTSEPLLAGNLS